ncbi:hypothetical protein [Methylocystis parvus]|uniref:hypothetical protein n=1 Tax=Methylocystis parvus TaxID=134 RepID=UPI003C7287F9
MLASLLLFLLYSIPPLGGWLLCFRAPLGRRRFQRSLHIPAPVNAVWAALDPRGPYGGWSFLYEVRRAEPISQSPLVLRLDRRPRHSSAAFERIEEECSVDEANRRILRKTRIAGGSSCEVTLADHGAGATVSVHYETGITGLLAYELTRLALARDLGAFEDAVLGRDAKEAPRFRFSGWRLALFGVVSGVVMILLILAPAFYVALRSVDVSIGGLLADPPALAFVLALALGAALFLATLLIAATLVHEMGHALALAAFGHRGVTVSLIPFGGGVAFGSRAYESAFEAGAVSLAGPALSALVALALMPDSERLSALMQGLLGQQPQFIPALIAVSGATFVLLTLLVNIPNILPWTGSDGSLALGAVFRCGRTRQIAAGLFAAVLAFVFAGVDDLLPFGLMFLALSWHNRKRPEAPAADAPAPWRSLAVAGALALVVGLYAHEAAALRRVEWLPPGQAPSAPDRA